MPKWSCHNTASTVIESLDILFPGAALATSAWCCIGREPVMCREVMALALGKKKSSSVWQRGGFNECSFMQRTLLFTAYYWPEATQNIFDPHILSFEQSRSSLESQFNILICVPGHSFLPLLCSRFKKHKCHIWRFGEEKGRNYSVTVGKNMIWVLIQ